MLKEKKDVLKDIIKNNIKWPLVLEGVSKENFPLAVVLSADCDSSNLGIIIGEDGKYIYPEWLKRVFSKAKTSKRVVLIIDGLDGEEPLKQEQFYGLLKYKAVNGLKLPDGVQIIIPVGKGGISKISKKILLLTNTFKVD